MFVLEQTGVSAYSIENAYAIRLESVQKNKLRYQNYLDYEAVIVIYYNNDGGCVLAKYKNMKEANHVFCGMLKAMSQGVTLIDLNGKITNPTPGPIDEQEPERGD